MSEAYWYKVRIQQGFDIDKPMTIQERIFWGSVKNRRLACEETTNPHNAIERAYPFDKQYFLSKWWDKLNTDEKERLLKHVWLNKGDSLLFGYEWWLPYFNEIGFTSNCSEQPTEPITLYRGAGKEVMIGMSWTNTFETARMFAEKEFMLTNTKVYKTVVGPENILAIYKGAAADINNLKKVYEVFDYVIDYQKLDVELIEEVIQA